MDKIVLTPKQKDCGMDIDLHGSLAGILTVASKHKDKAKRAEIIQQVISVAEGCDRYSQNMQETVVADAGIELNLSMFKIQETAVSSHFAKFYE